MHEPEGARPRARSPFAAAFLSLIFPGLGQLYAGAPARALAFAATPILFIALLAGFGLRMLLVAVATRSGTPMPTFMSGTLMIPPPIPSSADTMPANDAPTIPRPRFRTR